MYYYRAFGLVIESEMELNILSETLTKSEIRTLSGCDVRILRADLRRDLAEIPSNEAGYRHEVGKGWILYEIDANLAFRVSAGNEILVDSGPEVPNELLCVYLLGGCMGHILHQRGFTPFHGSCVTNGKDALLIIGESGAGKSTLAAEFLKHGWLILTDDIAVVEFRDGIPYVRPSYPSQKMWQDAIVRHEIEPKRLSLLWQEERKEKYHVNVMRQFCRDACRLKWVVHLIPGAPQTILEPVEGFAKVDRLLRNVYRLNVRGENRNRCFQTCVDLNSQIEMCVAGYSDESPAEKELYDMLCRYFSCEQ